MPMAGGDIGVYREILVSPASSSALAFVTTLHLALALLRRERSTSKPLLFASSLFVAAPWLLTSPAGLALGLLLHVAWFAACEKLGAPKAAGEPGTPAAGPIPGRPAPGFLPTPVLSVFDETPEIRTFRMARPPGFEFAAGQFLSVRVRVGGKPFVRCYTISSAPESRGHLEITVKRQGVVSTALHETLRTGSTLEIRGPGGHFRYPSEDRRPILLIGGGVGATPLMSMLRHAVAADPERPVTLLLSARTESDVPFRRELDEIETRHPRMRIVVALTRGEGDPRRFPGRIDENFVRSVAPEAAESVACLCGPLPMIASMKELLGTIGVPAERIHAEAFEAAVAWASREVAVPGGSRGFAPSSGESCEVVFARSGRRASASASETLLDAAEQAGVAIEFSCRSGICGTCRTRLVEGDVDAEAALDEADRREGWILPCVSFARGKCVIDA